MISERLEGSSGPHASFNAARSSDGVIPRRPARPPRPPRERPSISVTNLPRKPIAAIAMALALVVASFAGYGWYQSRSCTYFGEGRTALATPDGTFSLNVMPVDLRATFGAELSGSLIDISSASGRQMQDAFAQIGAQARAVSPLYRIRACGAPPLATLRFVLPAGMDGQQAGFLDAYSWDSTRLTWRWLGGQADQAARAFLLRTGALPDNVVLVQSSSGRSLAGLEALPDSSATADFLGAADRVTAVGLYLGDEGTISGDRSQLFGTPEIAAKRAVAVRNWNLRGDVNRTVLRTLLGVDAYRRSHVGNLVNVVATAGSPGLEIDYRGISEDDAPAYAEMLEALSRELRAQGKWLSVGLPSPTRVDGAWILPGYDLDRIGAVADEVKVDLATNPQLLSGNELEAMISWLGTRVQRSKVVAAVPMSSLSVAPNGDVAHISLGDASLAFGVVEPISKVDGAVTPGTRLSFRLRHRFEPQSLIFEETSQSYRYTFQDLRGIPQTVWVNNAASLGRLINRLSRVPLKGIAFRGLEPEFDDAATRQLLLSVLRRTAPPQGAELPRLTWSVTAPDTSIESESGKIQDNVFSWIVPANPGKYSINARFSGAGSRQSGGAYDVLVESRGETGAASQRALIVSSEAAGAAAADVPVTATRQISASGQAQTPLELAMALGMPKPVVAAGDDAPFEIGGHVAGLSSFERARTAGMTWVRLIVRDFADPSAFVSAAHANNFKVLVTAVGNKARIIDDDYQALWAAHLGAMAAAGADAIEVWNEPNLAAEWPAGRISGEAYTRLLARSYNAIKQRNARTMVISAGLAPTGAFNGGCTQQGCDDSAFLSEMARSGASEYADCIGVHYTSGTVSPAQSSGAAAGAHYSWYYAPLREQYATVFGGGRKLCFTSLGYLSADGLGPLPARYAWAENNALSMQTQWLAQAVALSQNSGRVRLLIVWNLDLNQWNLDRADVRAGYAMVRPNGSCPACDALRATIAPR